MDLITKYANIIAQEVNVKQVVILSEQLNYQKIYKPIGAKLKSYGAEAGMIISAGKAGQVTLLNDGKLSIHQGDKERILESDQYEIEYQGVDTTTINIDGDTIIRLDTQISADLQQEGSIREICRLLNQMRKDADYHIAHRVQCHIACQDPNVLDMIAGHEDTLCSEALLDHIDYGSVSQDGDITQSLELGNTSVFFSLSQ